FEQNAFAAAAAANDHDGFAFLDFKRNAIENFLRAEALSQVARLDHGASQRPTDMVKKKLLIKIQIDAATTASVVALWTIHSLERTDRRNDPAKHRRFDQSGVHMVRPAVLNHVSPNVNFVDVQKINRHD